MKYKNINDIEYFDFKDEDLAYRFIPLFGFYDNGWKQFIKTNQGFINLSIVELKDGLYFSKEPTHKGDIYSHFFNLMMKCHNTIENKKPLLHILEDINNLVASIEKINFFSNLNDKEDNLKLCRYASVELESIFQNSRAVFENLQKIQDNILKDIQSVNEDNLFTIKEVRFGYKKNKNWIRNLTIAEYIEKYKIPEQLAKFYVNYEKFFFFILDMRNDIFHSRKSFSLFLCEKGFSISIKDYNLEEILDWNEQNTLPNNLGSVRTLIAYIVIFTIKVLEDYAVILNQSIKLFDNVVPNYNLYLKNDFNKTLNELNTYIKDNAWNIR